MKKIILCAILATFLSSTAFADAFSGARFGGGFAKSDNDSTDVGYGFKLEVGYDLNYMTGVSLSYESNEKKISSNRNYDGSNLKLGADIGYVWILQGTTDKGVFVKPYLKAGLKQYKYDIETETSGTTYLYSYSGISPYYGLGARFQFENIYADLSLDTTTFVSDVDNDQIALTFGIKFK